ncbi:MAG: LPS export ABC transporter periplasmic protein LptC [Bacteroidaceae bacterium]|jgi:LPS export ABC transporter protein LptC
MSLRALPVGFLLFLSASAAFLSSCKEEKHTYAPPIKDRDSAAFLKTSGITTFISDSGITKYKIVTEEWDMYDRARVPRWAFEKGLELEEFDRQYKVVSTIECDTAYYYTLHRIWELRGNVKVKSTKGNQIYTSQLFWEQDKRKLYSNRPVHIVQPDKVIDGNSFESNQDMTQYVIYKMKGKVTFDENKLSAPPPLPANNPKQPQPDSLQKKSAANTQP